MKDLNDKGTAILTLQRIIEGSYSMEAELRDSKEKELTESEKVHLWLTIYDLKNRVNTLDEIYKKKTKITPVEAE